VGGVGQFHPHPVFLSSPAKRQTLLKENRPLPEKGRGESELAAASKSAPVEEPNGPVAGSGGAGAADVAAALFLRQGALEGGFGGFAAGVPGGALLAGGAEAAPAADQRRVRVMRGPPR
jgi:hypothetical protein